MIDTVITVIEVAICFNVQLLVAGVAILLSKNVLYFLQQVWHLTQVVFSFVLLIILGTVGTLTGSVKLWIEDGFLYFKLLSEDDDPEDDEHDDVADEQAVSREEQDAAVSLEDRREEQQQQQEKQQEDEKRQQQQQQ